MINLFNTDYKLFRFKNYWIWWPVLLRILGDIECDLVVIFAGCVAWSVNIYNVLHYSLQK